MFSRDRDLLDTGIARREWVTLSSAGHDVAQLQAIYSGGMFGTLLIGVTGWEVGSAVVAAAKSFPLPTLLIGGLAGWCLWRFWWDTERGAQHRAEARSLVKDAARGIGAAWDRADEAERLLEAAAFVPDDESTPLARVARIVAVAPIPPRATEVGQRLGFSTQKAAALLRAPIFVRTEEASYLLGRSHEPITSGRALTPAPPIPLG